jgi:hypothetical protein
MRAAAASSPSGQNSKPILAAGRKRKFVPSVAQRLVIALAAFLLERKAATGRLPRQKSATVVNKARELAAHEGVDDASDKIIREQIVSPAFKSIKAKIPETVSGKKP